MSAGTVFDIIALSFILPTLAIIWAAWFQLWRDEERGR